MTDTPRDEDLNSEQEEERLPWLEAVDEGEGDGPSALKLIVSVLIGLVTIGAIVGGIFWLGNRDSEAVRDAQLIEAPEGDYKERPADPGGMKVDGQGDSAFAASAGADPKGSIDTQAVPEAPVSRPAPTAKTPAAVPPRPAPPAPAPAASGPAIQLGAFSSQARAEAAWRAMAARFAYLAPLSHSVSSTTSGGRTLWRLRASGAGAGDVCGRLRAAGESCTPVG